MPPDDRERIAHMLEAIAQASAFARGRARHHLESDRMLELALARLVEIVGEAAKHVSQPVRDLDPDIPWKEICGARDRLAHGYFAVDHAILWKIVSEDLASLEARLQSILHALSPPRTAP
jgi:uncharacterized protein with HEPN domain